MSAGDLAAAETSVAVADRTPVAAAVTALIAATGVAVATRLVSVGPIVWVLAVQVVAVVGVVAGLRSHRSAPAVAPMVPALATAPAAPVPSTVTETDRYRASLSDLLVNLARRNQSLLDRQVALIGALEQRERDPDVLQELFKLDHLATRVRRNAESLLVLAGDEPPRQWSRPVRLDDVVRAAMAEIEDYTRIELVPGDALAVAGNAVAQLAHLLAELLENATTFSPPSQPVRVQVYRRPDRGALIIVEDRGLGMPAEARTAANELLANPPELEASRTALLGFQVVGRLARRLGTTVTLSDNPDGGVSALVELPVDLVVEPTTDGPVTEPRARSLSVVPPVADRPPAVREREPVAAVARPAPVEPAPTTTLARRVPGAQLAPGLRSAADGPSAGERTPDDRRPMPAMRSPEDLRAALSRFQLSQEAGRAVAATTEEAS